MDARRTDQCVRRGNKSIRDYAKVKEKAERPWSTGRLPRGCGTWSVGVATVSALRQPSLVHFLKKNKGKRRTASTAPASPVAKQSKGVPASLISRGVRKKAISLPSTTVRPEVSGVTSSRNKENQRDDGSCSLKSSSVLSACEEKNSKTYSEDLASIREPLSERTPNLNFGSQFICSYQHNSPKVAGEETLPQQASRDSASKLHSFKGSSLRTKHEQSPRSHDCDSTPKHEQSPRSHDCGSTPGARVVAGPTTTCTSGDSPLFPELEALCDDASFERNTDDLLAELSYCGKVRF